MKRRDLLKGAPADLPSDSRSVGSMAPPRKRPHLLAGRPLDPALVDSLLEIAADGAVTIYTSKVDVGTGMRVAMAQMAAEELGVAVARVTVVDGDTGRCPNTGGTGGSTGLTRGGTAVRQAAATARQALLARAAERLKRPASELTIAAGVVRPAAGGRGVRIESLAAGGRLNVNVDPKAPLIGPGQVRAGGAVAAAAGRPENAPDDTPTSRTSPCRACSTRVVRPPGPGATLVSVNDAPIRQLPDVQVVRVQSFLAVVAADEWAAVRAAREIEAQWTPGPPLPGHDRLEPYLRQGVVDRDQVLVEQGRPSRWPRIRPRRPDADGDLLLAVPEPCVAGAVGRGCRRARRRGDDLDVVSRRMGCAARCRGSSVSIRRKSA